MEPKIISVVIGPYPRPTTLGMLLDPMPEVVATFDDNTVKKLFTFFPDELSFTEAEFIGLTETQARVLRLNKDIAYLQSKDK